MKPLIDYNNPEKDLPHIANQLMNKWDIQSNEKKYRITEIEFYINSAAHKDTYAHGHKLQKTTGKWYMHGSGMDITCGNKDNNGAEHFEGEWIRLGSEGCARLKGI